jgi:pyrimidine-nucleoside phosphorylase
MSKKIAAGADAIVLDVKTGSGAFMKSLEESEALARAMVDIGTQVGRRTAALISDMDQPLGFAIGNALEVREAIETLRGQGPQDLTELCVALGAHMVMLGGQADTLEAAEALVREKLASGAALDKFRTFVETQGGNPAVADDPALLPQAPLIIEVTAQTDGFIERIDAEQLGFAAMLLGAGRATKDAGIDHAVGLTMRKKTGERVEAGEAIVLLHAREDDSKVREVEELVRKAFTIGGRAPSLPPLLQSVVTESGTHRYG